MKKNMRRWLWVSGVAAGLSLAGPASAQSTFQPFKGLFGPKTEQKAVEQKAPDANRQTEIQIELAWLSDRATFPYYLEAHVKGANVEVKGYVPTKAVRDQALNLARLNSPYPVTDAMKEHSSLAIHPVNRSPDQLKSSVQTILREDFPRVKMTVQCQSDGTVQLTGNVKTFEQKLAVSKALRRLHGCTSVTNFTQVENMALQTPNLGSHIVQTGATSAVPAKVLPPQNTPYESRGVVVVPSEDAVSTKNAATVGTLTAPSSITPTAMSVPFAPAPNVPAPKAQASMASGGSAVQLKKKIEAALPNLHNVLVTFTSKTDVRVECTVRANDDPGAIAGQILSVHELEPYKVDLQIQVPMAEQK